MALAFSFNLTTHAETLLILDSGHDPKFKGAVSSFAITEYKLNDDIVQAVLKQSQFKIILTRNNNEPPALLIKNDFTNIESLKSRMIISNQHEDNAVFVSIHHDSVSEKHIVFDPGLCDGHGGKRISDNFKKEFQIGFNVFVYEENTERYKQSLQLAKIVSAKLIALGQIPSNYHFPASDDCKSCKPIDIKSGIWHQNLLVLRENKIPAILIEVGNLMDPDDYKKITSETFKRNFGSLINESIKEFDKYKELKN